MGCSHVEDPLGSYKTTLLSVFLLLTIKREYIHINLVVD